MKNKYHKAIFIQEGKQRFICTILVDKLQKECYVSSSTKLSKYLPLKNCKVWVAENMGNNLRTCYTLEAVEYRDILYYVNFNNANRLYEKLLLSQKIVADAIHREYIAEGIVKTDFFVEEYGYIEIKSLLSNTNTIIFPDTSSNRLAKQLLQYIEILKMGLPVTFVFIAMASTLTNFSWNDKKKDVQAYFIEACLLGMKIKAFSVVYANKEFSLCENKTLEKNIGIALST